MIDWCSDVLAGLFYRSFMVGATETVKAIMYTSDVDSIRDLPSLCGKLLSILERLELVNEVPLLFHASVALTTWSKKSFAPLVPPLHPHAEESLFVLVAIVLVWALCRNKYPCLDSTVEIFENSSCSTLCF